MHDMRYKTFSNPLLTTLKMKYYLLIMTVAVMAMTPLVVGYYFCQQKTKELDRINLEKNPTRDTSATDLIMDDEFYPTTNTMEMEMDMGMDMHLGVDNEDESDYEDVGLDIENIPLFTPLTAFQEDDGF